MISFIIPTRNEPEIRTLIDKIKQIIKNQGEAFEIIVIDKSDDDTMLRAAEAGVKVFAQKSMGLGGALIEGLEKARGEIAFTMDADFSHDPEHIPKFLEKIKRGFDVVVGSRKLKGGDVKGWGIKRKMVSGGANFIGRFIAGVRVSDLTSGYRAYRLSAIRRLDFNLFTGRGFSFQLEILFYLLKKGFKATAVPIVFFDRRKGKSKLSKREIGEFLKTSFKLFWLRIKEKIK